VTALADSMMLPNWMTSRPEGLTAKDYEALPDEVSRRIEVVDGAIIVTPSPRRDHQFIMFRLADDIYEAVHGRYRVTADVDVRLRDEPLLVRKADIVVYDAALPSEAVMRPAHCALVVEIMSPGSVTTDQNDKPAEYAAAGIEHFWRIEDINEKARTLKIFRYQLDRTTHTYALAGLDTDTLTVTDPFHLTIKLADLF
jgi:Uma2 family endonuclease